MLKLLRKKGVMKKILWVVAVVIILSFGIFGTANRLANRGRARYAGKIFGKKVSFDEFRKSLFHARNQAVMRYGEKFHEIREFLNLEAEAWDRLILLREAEKRKLKVTDKEVRDAILNLTFFQRNGHFDQQLYNNILRYAFRCEPRFFEEGMRQSLLFAKLYEDETSFVEISESALLEEYKRKNEQAKASYILFSAGNYTDEVKLVPEETQQYYEQHSEEFRAPEEINVQFVSFPYPDNAQESDKNEVTLRAKTIEQKLQQNSDFLAVSNENNLVIEESGFFSMEKPNLKLGWSLELMQKTFRMKQDQVSGALETPKGYYIIRLKERKDSYIPEFKDVQEKVRKSLTAKKAKEIAKDKAQGYQKEIAQALKENPQAEFSATVKQLGLKVDQTPLFVRGQYLPNIGISKEFQESVFALTAGAISDTIEIPKGYAIAYRDEFIPVDEDKFQQEKEVFSQTILAQRKNEVFSNFLMRLRSKANLESSLAAPDGQ